MNHGGVYDLSSNGRGGACDSARLAEKNIADFKAGPDSIQIDGESTAVTKTFGHIAAVDGVPNSDGDPSGCGYCFLVRPTPWAGKYCCGTTQCETASPAPVILIMGVDTFEPSSPEIGEDGWKKGLEAYGPATGCGNSDMRWWFDYQLVPSGSYPGCK